MTWHLYLLPVVTDAKGARVPKYLSALGLPSEMLDYGPQPIALAAADVSDADDATLTAAADVQRIPDALDAAIGAGALNVVQNALETRNLPADWVTAGTTYRILLRTVGGFFAFVQRFATVTGSNALLLGGAVNLNTTLAQLPAARRQALRDTATSLGLDIGGLGGATTLRAALKSIADQWGQRPFNLNEIAV
jgi:hypothetical protein